jgi:hypothetical protein
MLKVEKEENKDVQPIDKKVLKLPEACFKEIPNYKISLAPPLPTKYFDFVEKSQEELDKVRFKKWINLVLLNNYNSCLSPGPGSSLCGPSSRIL